MRSVYKMLLTVYDRRKYIEETINGIFHVHHKHQSGRYYGSIWFKIGIFPQPLVIVSNETKVVQRFRG
jgi:hypothetical protein